LPSGKNNVDAEPASFEHAAALEREAATREILQVISRSRDDEKPVFDTILENARRLCKAPMAGLILGRAQDHYQTLAAQHESKDSTIKLYRSDQVPMDPRVSYVAQAIHECRVIHLVDMSDSELYRAGSPYVRALVDIEGIRTILFVPLIAGGEAIGAITLFRHEVAAFDDRDIALVETFAAQAVIAIENVRQFRELQSRLEREVATRRILQVISRSREDDEPVLTSSSRTSCDSATRPRPHSTSYPKITLAWKLSLKHVAFNQPQSRRP